MFDTKEKAAEYGKQWRAKNAAYLRAYRLANKDKRSAQNREWSDKNRARKNAIHRKWSARNPDKVKEKLARWQLDNIDYVKSKQKEYRTRNRAALNALSAKKRAAKRSATPPWLTAEMKAEIVAIYKACEKRTSETGVKHHVDHIEPLLGKDSCGLHVPWNLQILTAEENIKKGNSINAILAAEVLAALLDVEERLHASQRCVADGPSEIVVR